MLPYSKAPAIFPGHPGGLDDLMRSLLGDPEMLCDLLVHERSVEVHPDDALITIHHPDILYVL